MNRIGSDDVESLTGGCQKMPGVVIDQAPMSNPRGLDVKVMPASDEGAGRLTEIV